MNVRQPHQNLGTYSGCSPLDQMHSERHELNRNLIDKKAYPDLAKMEQEVLQFMRGLVELDENGMGIITSGSSEAIILALSFHLRNFDRRNCGGKRPNFIISKLNHNVFDKFAALFHVEQRTLPVDPQGRSIVQAAESLIDENTFCIVGIAGTTETGTVDDLKALALLATRFQISLHIDAAIGGCVLPYIPFVQPWNFAQLPVATMNISLTKYGSAVPGLGVLLLRDKNCIPENYPTRLRYISGGSVNELGMLCSRNAFPLAHFYRRLCGWKGNGHRRFIRQCFSLARILKRELQQAGFQVLRNSLPIVVFRHENEVSMNIFKDLLEKRGYVIGDSFVEPMGERYIRIVVKSGFTSSTLLDLLSCLKLLKERHHEYVYKEAS